MPFPIVNRVIYKKNPLTQVICQLRFPTILKIETKIPAEFQNEIRKDLPIYEETLEWPVDIPKEMAGNVSAELLKSPSFTANKNYGFYSENGNWRINLTRNFIALTNEKYEKWEVFRDFLFNIINKFNIIYSPGNFTRVGLRYIDVIKRSSLGLENVDWTELLQPYTLGILATTDVGKSIKNYESGYEILLEDERSRVRMLFKLVEQLETREKCFMIDSDFSNSEKSDLESAKQKLDYFNKRASRLIQWVITEKLHNAMEPSEI